MSSRLGIVAGGGSLPARLIKACYDTGREVFVIAVKGQADADQIAAAPHAWVRLGAPGKAVKLMRARDIQEITIAGSFQRPSLLEVFPDRLALQFLLEVGRRVLRDDGIHAAIASWAERLGFRLVGPESVDGDLLAVEGVYGRISPDAEARQDIERGIEVARAIGRVDVGQGAIVQQGVVLAVEAAEGTDAMIARAGQLQRKGPGGVLVKVKKPGQERRIDLPAIGLQTVVNAKAAGLRGIAIEAGAAIVIDREAVARAADESGIFVVGVKIPE